MAQSRFVSLTPYCVVEYQFEPIGSLNFYSDDFIFVENSVTGGHQIFNTDSSYPSIKNIRDLNAVSIGNNTYVYLDSEKVPNYLAYDPNLTSTTLSGYNVVLDNVRFHFVAGFDFDDFRALILSIVHTENNGTNNVFANVLLAPETIVELIIFNPRPLFLSNAVYDRYIDILVPSIKNINEDFVTSPVPSTTFSAAITPGPDGPVGFIYNNPITISLLECGIKKTIYTNTSLTYDAYEVSEVFTTTISQSNEFDNVGAYVNESIAGDYLEFYLTFNSGFPGELISILNNRNPADDWIIIHQLSIFEQVGTSFINTSRLIFFQEDLYDEPNVFRPVLKNAHEAISMAVDYVARLTNRRNGEQIIREGSFSLIAPKKYGKNLINLPLLDKPQSQKVYNKIIKNNFEATPLFIEPTPISQQPVITPAVPAQINEVVRTEFIPIFFNNSNISISNVSSMATSADSSEEVIFGPGKLRFVLSPFDNVIKLKVFTEATLANATNPLVPLDLNVNAPKYRLVFETTSGKISVDNVNDANQENLSTGQLAFNVSKKDSEAISNSKNKVVYLVSVSQDGRETLIYTGEWRKPSEQANVDAAIAQAKAEANNKKSTKTVLENIRARLESISKMDSTAKVNLNSNVKEKAVVPIVNKFGVSNSKSIQATSSNTKKNTK
jgi:hypothetical protein